MRKVLSTRGQTALYKSLAFWTNDTNSNHKMILSLDTHISYFFSFLNLLLLGISSDFVEKCLFFTLLCYFLFLFLATVCYISMHDKCATADAVLHRSIFYRCRELFWRSWHGGGVNTIPKC